MIRMNDAIQIDAATGEVSLGSFRVTPQTRTGALPERPVQVAGTTLLCQFATAAVLDDATPVTVGLRFEAGMQVSVFFGLAQPASDDDIEAAEQRHRRWIAKKLGQDPGSMTAYSWGSAGVAQDKSGGVYVFLHHRNDSLAR